MFNGAERLCQIDAGTATQKRRFWQLPFSAVVAKAVFPAMALAPKSAIMSTLLALPVAFGFQFLATGFLNWVVKSAALGLPLSSKDMPR